MILPDVESLITVFLIFLRVFFFLFMIPFFGTFFLPTVVRIYFSFAIAFSFLLMETVEPVRVDSSFQLVEIALKEALFGFTAGFILRLIFDAITVAGEIIAVHAGLGFLMMFLPQQPQTTVLAGFSVLLGSALFLSLGGAETVYIGILKSLETVPPGYFDLYSLSGEKIISFFYSSFALGVKVALPVLIASLLTNIILAVVNRFIPQINVFMVGLPLQIMVGLIVFALSLPVIGIVLTSHMREYMFSFMRFMVMK